MVHYHCLGYVYLYMPRQVLIIRWPRGTISIGTSTECRTVAMIQRRSSSKPIDWQRTHLAGELLWLPMVQMPVFGGIKGCSNLYDFNSFILLFRQLES